MIGPGTGVRVYLACSSDAYAAQHLAECAALADRIEDFGELETHIAYLARLKSQHGRKNGFWSRVD